MLINIVWRQQISQKTFDVREMTRDDLLSPHLHDTGTIWKWN